MNTLAQPGDDPKQLSGWAMATFVAGWAIGGLIFGSLGDRIGRAKTLAITVLIYSLFTGLSSFAQNFTQFAILRALTGMGVGGVFGLAVALVSDALPTETRSKALGLLQALSAVGNVTAGLCAYAVAEMDPTKSWKVLFWIGSIPAILCIPIMTKLKEPQKWLDAKAESKVNADKQMGSYYSLLQDVRWRKSALMGMMLCVAAVVGLWGVGFFSGSLVGPAIETYVKSTGVTDAKILSAEKQKWTAINLIVQNIGAFFGMYLFARAAQRFGRKPVFAVGFVAALVSTVIFFQFFKTKSDLWMSGLMGFCQLSLFAGFAIYLPELFPTRLRSTGVSFCYNVGRFIAATGPLTLGNLQKYLGDKAVIGLDVSAHLAARTDAFRTAATYLSFVFLLGLVALIFLPETKDRPLPEG